jgi:hypothetical protein
MPEKAVKQMIIDGLSNIFLSKKNLDNDKKVVEAVQLRVQDISDTYKSTNLQSSKPGENQNKNQHSLNDFIVHKGEEPVYPNFNMSDHYPVKSNIEKAKVYEFTPEQLNQEVQKLLKEKL